MNMAMQKTTMKNQKGMTMIGWLFMLTFIGFNALVAINVAPVYFTDSSVKTIWAGLETDADVRGKSPKNLRKIIHKRLRINNIYDVDKSDIEIQKTQGSYVVSLEYEPRGRIIGSLDYIITFSHEVSIPIR